MNIIFFYSQNETGEELKNFIQKEWMETEIKYVLIDESEYIEMHILDPHSEHKLVINSMQAIKNLQKEKFAQILSINNIPFISENNSDKINRVYEILLCDFNIISIRVKTSSKNKETFRYIREIDNPKIIDMARKAIYSLGLDIGKVFVILNTRKQYKISHIDPSPVLRKKETEAIKYYLRKMYALESIKNKEVKMGADPEFMIINAKTQKIVAASDFFPREGIVGCDNIRMPNRQQRPIAEIRPKPTPSPLELTENIKQALLSANKMAPYKNIKWLAGSQPFNGYYIGGHIHFSNIDLNFKLLRALDNYLGIIVSLIENPLTAARRRKKYGFIGDFRTKEHGGFEYRTPGSWLISPAITAAVLCLAKIVASRYPYLSANYLCSAEVQKAFYNGEHQYLKKYFPYLWNDIQNTDLYLIYKEHLKIIPDMIEEGITWNETADFRIFWNITPKRIYDKSKTDASVNKISIRTHQQQTRTNRILLNNRSMVVQNTNTRNRNRRVNNTLPVRINRSGQIRRN